MVFHEMCDKIDEILHDHGKIFAPLLILVAALALLGIGYVAMHPISQADNTNASQSAGK